MDFRNAGAHASTAETRGFVSAIRQDLETDAYRIIPFTGAGFSVPSGIPTAAQLSRYQIYCLLRALGIDPFQRPDVTEQNLLTQHPFDLRSGSLPDMAAEMVQRRSVITASVLEQLLKTAFERSDKLELTPQGNKIILSKPLLQLAYGAVADWRAALDVLSRIEIKFESHTLHVVKSSPDPTVIDTFFRHLIALKRPSLGHRMLPALCSTLRSHVILSTNFDELIEEAFRAVDHPLAVFVVPRNAALPGAPLVLAQRSLVKLHGSAHGLWADDAIDREPDDADRRNFLGYLARRNLSSGSHFTDRTKNDDCVALLLIGQSGQDQRTLSLLRAAIDKFSRLHIYWLCYADADEKHVRKEFHDWIDKDRGGTFVRCLRHLKHELFLLQLYQACSASIPSSGIIFPALWELPAPVEFDLPKQRDSGSHNKFLTACSKKINDNISAGIPVWIESKSDRAGVVVCGELFTCESLGVEPWPRIGRSRRIWIDLENIVEPVGVFLRLSTVLARIQGDADPICAFDVESFYDYGGTLYNRFVEALKSHLMEVHARSGERTIVFMNAFDGPGVKPLFAPAARTNRWADAQALENFLGLLKELNMAPECGVQFVLITGSGEKFPDVAAIADADIRADVAASLAGISDASRALRDTLGKMDWKAMGQGTPYLRYNPADVAQEAWNFIESGHALPGEDDRLRMLRAHFVYLLALFRIARYPAGVYRIFHSFVTELRLAKPGIPRPRLSNVRKTCERWMETLQECGLICAKDGDFQVMDYIVKDAIRAKLERTRRISRDNALHLEGLVARWYGRLLLASANPLAAMESMEHGLKALSNCLRASDRGVITSMEWDRLSITIDHAHLIFEAARALWRQRLSDQFAKRALIVLHRLAEEAEAALGAGIAIGGGSAQDAQRLQSRIIALSNAIQRFQSSLLLEEGEFQYVIDLTDKMTQDPGALDGKMIFHARLERAIARICLRHYDKAGEELEELWRGMRGPEIGRGSPSSEARKWLSESGTDMRDIQEKRRMLTRLARNFLYLTLHRSQAIYCELRIRGDSKAAAMERRKLLIEIGQWIVEFALELLRGYDGDNQRFIFEENVRLRVHAALCCGIVDFCALEAGESGDGISERRLAEAMLTDAEAFIDEYPLKEGGVNRVILELRRAELEFLRINETSLEGKSEFRDFRASLASTRWRREPLSNPNPVLARIEDAFRYLERAEHELRKHPKSRWWWWIYCTLKMKAVEYLFVVKFSIALGSWTRGGDGVARPRWRPLLEEQGGVMYDATIYFNHEVMSIVRRCALTDCFQLARLVDSYCKTLNLCMRQAEVFSLGNTGPSIRGYEVNVKVLTELRDRLASARRGNAEMDRNVASYTEMVLNIADKRLSEI